MSIQTAGNGNASQVSVLESRGLTITSNTNGLLSIEGKKGTYKCSECGENHAYSKVDLGTLCLSCFSPMITDTEAALLDSIDPII